MGSIAFGLYVITRVLGIDVGGGGGGGSSRPRGKGRKRGRCGAAGLPQSSVPLPVHLCFSRCPASLCHPAVSCMYVYCGTTLLKDLQSCLVQGAPRQWCALKEGDRCWLLCFIQLYDFTSACFKST